MYREKWKVAATLYNHYGSTGIGLVVDMGDNSHAAIYVPNGTFSGFRPMSRSYDNGTYTLKATKKRPCFSSIHRKEARHSICLESAAGPTIRDSEAPQRQQHYHQCAKQRRHLRDGKQQPQFANIVDRATMRNHSVQQNLDAWIMWFSYEA